MKLPLPGPGRRDRRNNTSTRSYKLRIELESLLNLQETDLKIRKLLEEKAECPKRLEALQEQVEEEEAGLKEMTERLTQLNKHKIELEDELELENVRLNKSQQRLSTIKTDREYQAVFKEIEDIKRANKEREEEILVTMEQIQELEEEIKSKKKELSQLKKEMEAERKQVEKVEKELAKKISSLEKERDKLAAKVKKDLLRKYDFLKDKRQGIVVATVTAGVCSGCHMNIPPQLFNELLRDEKIHVCPTCQRIIYAVKEKEGAEA